MTSITDLRSSLEAFRKAGTIDASIYANLTSKLKATETDFESVQNEVLACKDSLARLIREKFVLEQEKSSLAAQVTKLLNEKAELESQIPVLQKSRVALSSSNLISSFASSLAEIDKGLNQVQSGPKYSVSNVSVTLKTNLALEGEELRFHMPKVDDIIGSGNLSTITFSLKAVPEKAGIDSYKEVPDLVDLSREKAEIKLFKAGFKAGEILEKESSVPQSQFPSESSLAGPPKPEPKLVPRIVGMSLEKAISLLEAQGVKVGSVSEAISTITAGTVIGQKPVAGSTVNISVPMNLVVSKKAPEN